MAASPTGAVALAISSPASSCSVSRNGAGSSRGTNRRDAGTYQPPSSRCPRPSTTREMAIRKMPAGGFECLARLPTPHRHQLCRVLLELGSDGLRHVRCSQPRRSLSRYVGNPKLGWALRRVRGPARPRLPSPFSPFSTERDMPDTELLLFASELRTRASEILVRA